MCKTGHLLENLVFTALHRFTQGIFYYRTRSGREVDFVVQRKGGRSRMLVQICESMAEPQVRKREISALAEAMNELGLVEGTIVTRNEEEEVGVEPGTIAIIPVWRFLLALPEEQEG